MSYKATNWAYDLPLTGSMKPVLVALADMADESGSCYPSQARIAAMTGFSERTVRNALAGLEEHGLLARISRYEKVRGRLTDRYVLSVGTDLPATLASKSIYRQKTSDLPAKNVVSTGNSCRGTTSEPLENQYIGEVIDIDDLQPGTRTPQPLPDPYILTKEMREWAAQHTPGLNVENTTREFVAYWRLGEGAGKKKKNWVLTWRNWMKNQHSRLPASERTERRVKRLR